MSTKATQNIAQYDAQESNVKGVKDDLCSADL